MEAKNNNILNVRDLGKWYTLLDIEKIKSFVFVAKKFKNFPGNFYSSF